MQVSVLSFLVCGYQWQASYFLHHCTILTQHTEPWICVAVCWSEKTGLSWLTLPLPQSATRVRMTSWCCPAMWWATLSPRSPGSRTPPTSPPRHASRPPSLRKAFVSVTTVRVMFLYKINYLAQLITFLLENFHVTIFFPFQVSWSSAPHAQVTLAPILATLRTGCTVTRSPGRCKSRVSTECCHEGHCLNGSQNRLTHHRI